MAARSLKTSPRALCDAVHGRLHEHHRFLLELHPQRWDALDAAIRQIDRQVAERIEQLDKEVADGKPLFCEVISRLP